jgi:hypothetical protein
MYVVICEYGVLASTHRTFETRVFFTDDHATLRAFGMERAPYLERAIPDISISGETSHNELGETYAMQCVPAFEGHHRSHGIRQSI